MEGKRGQGQRRKLVVSVEEVEHELDPKDTTQFEPSHAQDLPNMVMMGNLHEAPLLYLLQRRLKNGDIYTWAGDVLISLNPYSPIASLYQVLTMPLPLPLPGLDLPRRQAHHRGEPACLRYLEARAAGIRAPSYHL